MEEYQVAGLTTNQLILRLIPIITISQLGNQNISWEAVEKKLWY